MFPCIFPYPHGSINWSQDSSTAKQSTKTQHNTHTPHTVQKKKIKSKMSNSIMLSSLPICAAFRSKSNSKDLRSCQPWRGGRRPCPSADRWRCWEPAHEVLRRDIVQARWARSYQVQLQQVLGRWEAAWWGMVDRWQCRQAWGGPVRVVMHTVPAQTCQGRS